MKKFFGIPAGLCLIAGLVVSGSCGLDERIPSPPVKATIGDEGGKIVGPANSTVTFPAGATATDTLITVSELTGTTPPPGTAAVATPLRLEPSGKIFDQPVEILVSVGNSLPPGSAITDVLVLRAPQGTLDFLPLPTRVAGPGLVAVVTEHFSDFIAVVADTDGGAPFGACGDGVCGAGSSEDCNTCPVDCGLCFSTTTDICGDLTCGATESCATCPYDCTCTSVCEYDNGGCAATATCVEVAGAPSCSCPAGTTDVVGNGTVCSVNGSCTASSCLNGGTCAVAGSGFTCTCPAGFEGLRCEVVSDPCAGTPCKNGGTCAPNGTTSFTCTCPAEWTGADCAQDVNECATGVATCSANATCTNTAGSFTCACNSGYTGDGVTCTPSSFDECAANTDNCSVNATCTDLPVGFSCACNSGYTGDGVTCTASGCVPSADTDTGTATFVITHLGLGSTSTGFNLDGINSTSRTIAGCNQVDGTGGIDNGLAVIASALAGLIDTNASLQASLETVQPDGGVAGTMTITITLDHLAGGLAANDSCVGVSVAVTGATLTPTTTTGAGTLANNVFTGSLGSMVTLYESQTLPSVACVGGICNPATMATNVMGPRLRITLDAAHTQIAAGSFLAGILFYEDTTSTSYDPVNPLGYKASFTNWSTAANMDPTQISTALTAYANAMDLHMDAAGTLSPCTSPTNSISNTNRNAVSATYVLDSL